MAGLLKRYAFCIILVELTIFSLDKIKAKYAFGNKEFGLRKIYVYKEVLRCPECHHDGKMKTVRRSIIDEPELIDPDFGNEMNFIVLEDAPMCMALKGPSQSSVWYNQSGEVNFLPLLIARRGGAWGVIL